MRRIIIYILSLILLTSCKETNEELFDKAYNLGKEKKYDKAIETYTKLIKRNRRLQLPYYNRGIMYMQIEKYEKALKDFDEVLSLQNYGSGFILHLTQTRPLPVRKTGTRFLILMFCMKEGRLNILWTA